MIMMRNLIRCMKDRAACVAVAMLSLTSGLAIAHPGHDAPTVHSHTGSPSMLAVIAIMLLGLAALVPLARVVIRRRRLRRQR
ncbi:hypothetical protein [Halomonas urumqiensis]|uniref:Uncharacterized protein n=1 Tax=Halomonas urumqiensis TaxID=1684789 RepID=A0A2N7UFU7_9GAMM|nr:hypothetical protein [Halomonas urumqiensis]PMR79291.1 hypothetical protein C1H70_13470 [Halomonas urumqiensis]PTB03965.1 hypothetical protein C6V82_05755 [Halomonas urumqiensis]GHE19781.1 hypothetical protein GCM10017767_03020 [Halomonas urumqiensis]